MSAASTSENACLVRFKGGPLNGRVQLEDHPHYSEILISGERGSYKTAGVRSRPAVFEWWHDFGGAV